MEGGANKPNRVETGQSDAPFSRPEDAASAANESKNDMTNSGEQKEISDQKIAAILRMGRDALTLSEIEIANEVGNNADTALIVSEVSQTDKKNAVNEAVDQYMHTGSKIETFAKNLFFVKPFIASYKRALANSAVRRVGNTEAAFEALGITPGSKINKDGSEYTQRRARLALDEAGFNDGKKVQEVTQEDSLSLNKNEYIENVGGKETNKVNKALKNLFNELSDAKKHGDAEAMKLAREQYNQKLEEFQKEGLFGDQQATAGQKIIESKFVQFLAGDHSKRTMTELDSLRKAADGVELLVENNLAEDRFNQYVDQHVSLYKASMQEGVYTKQKVNNVMAAVAAGGIVGGVLYTALGRQARTQAKAQALGEAAKAVAQEATSEAAKKVAANALSGGLVGAAFGAVRGAQAANVKMSEAEIRDATSAEAIVTPEERAEAAKQEAVDAAKNEVDNSAEDAVENEGEQGVEGVSKKRKIAAVFEKIGKIKRNLTGEDLHTENINKLRDRKSAKELYDTLGRKSNMLEILETTNPDQRLSKIKELANGNSAELVKMLKEFAETDGVEGFYEKWEGKMNDETRKKFEAFRELPAYVEINDIIAKAFSEDAKKNGKELTNEELQGIKDKYFSLILDSKDNSKRVRDSLADTIAEAQARNKVSAEKNIDLISYSKGNVSRERFLLSERMTEVNKKWLQDPEYKSMIQDKVLEKAKAFSENDKKIKGERGAFIARQAIVDAITGGMIGAAAGAAFTYIKVQYAQSANKAEVAAAAGSTASDGVEEAAASTDEVTNGGNEITFSEDENGGYAVFSNGEKVIGEGDEAGIHFNPETGQIEESDLELLRERVGDIEVNTISEKLPSAHAVRSVEEYFNKGNTEYLNENAEQGFRISEVHRSEWLSNSDGSPQAIINMAQTPGEGVVNEGDIVMQVVPNGTTANVGDLQVVLTPDKELTDMGIVLDVADDGTVTIPAGSVAASMFSDGNFSGRYIEVVQAAGDDNFNILGTLKGSDTLSEVGFQHEMEKITYVYNIGGTEITAPTDARVEFDMHNVGAESLRDSGPVNYENPLPVVTEEELTAGRTTFSPENGQVNIIVNGAATSDAKEALSMPTRSGNFSEAYDPFFSAEKDKEALNGPNLIRALVDPNREMEAAEADAAFAEAIENGNLSTNTILNAYLEEVGNSPEQVVEMRAMLGDLQFDIDGDGTMELIDTEAEVNAVADILKNSAEGEGYSAFVNDTFSRLFEKLNGGEIRLVKYADEPYDYTTLGYTNDANNVLHLFARKKTACDGIGLEFLDEEGNSIYDFDIARKLWKMSSSAKLQHITERLNCCQKTADVTWIKKAAQAVAQEQQIRPSDVTMEQTSDVSTENPRPSDVAAEQTSDVSTENPTPSDIVSERPSDPKAEAPSDPTAEAPSDPATEAPSDEAAENPLPPKTGTNPWEGRNPGQMPTTPGFEEESGNNGGAPIVQPGEETPPPPNEEGVNPNEGGQQDWAEPPSSNEDTGTGGTEDQSAGSDDEAARRFRENMGS